MDSLETAEEVECEVFCVPEGIDQMLVMAWERGETLVELDVETHPDRRPGGAPMACSASEART